MYTGECIAAVCGNTHTHTHTYMHTHIRTHIHTHTHRHTHTNTHTHAHTYTDYEYTSVHKIGLRHHTSCWASTFRYCMQDLPAELVPVQRLIGPVLFNVRVWSCFSRHCFSRGDCALKGHYHSAPAQVLPVLNIGQVQILQHNAQPRRDEQKHLDRICCRDSMEPGWAWQAQRLPPEPWHPSPLAR